jgi:hypothetical protein
VPAGWSVSNPSSRGVRGQPGAAYLNKKNVVHNIPNLTGPVDSIIAGAAVTTLKELYPAYTALFDDALGTVNPAAFAPAADR